jgi:molybdenum cofactor guanylyltransferase
MTTLAHMEKHEQIQGLILAGGRGQRMNGADKGLLTFKDIPLVSHVARRLRPQVADLVIACNRNQHEYEQIVPDATLLNDQRPDFPGPLAGVEAALQASQYDFLLVCPCDSPFLPENLGSTLLSALLASDSDAAVVHDGKRQQHLFFVLRCSAKEELTSYLDSGERRVFGFLERIKTETVDFSTQSEAFLNINSPDVLGKLENGAYFRTGQ